MLIVAALAVVSAFGLSPGPKAAVALNNCSVSDLTFDAQEQQFLTLINDYRAQNGLSALQTSVSLNRAASWLAVDMATNAYFSHTDSAGRGLGTRLTDCDDVWNSAGENIAAGTRPLTPSAIVRMWIKSPPHRENLLDRGFRHIGVGMAGGTMRLVTADFSGR